MCGDVVDETSEEIRKHFDPQSRYVIYDGVATRYVGLAEDILREIKEAGFRILDWRIEQRKDGENDSDMLSVAATK